ncbi:hypothetical protein [Alkalibaculum bacchi]|uniref:hypothetical protein n=1 Tax=Alkalibaculum bacchi TaxID=645887 RepID=UPI0026F3642B|nr:hypothetical protein [Alkalibaculum bacchi]
MDKTQPSLYYLTYDQLKANKDFPKSFSHFWWWLLQRTGRGIKKGFVKNIITLFFVMLATFILNSVFLIFINDTMYLENRGGNSSLIAYIFSGILDSSTEIKGFQFISARIPNIFWTLPMMFLLSGLIFNIFRRIRANGFKKLISEILHSGKLAKVYASGSSKTINYFILSGCFWATIIGFIVQNPITLFLLPIILFLSFTLKENSKIISLISTYLIAININKKKPRNVNVANIALSILGLSIGFAIHFVFALVIWIVFDYALLARIIFSIILAVLFYILKRGNNKIHTNKVMKASGLIFSFVCITTFCNYIVYADDGGWVESGRSLMGWLSNPGSKIISRLGLGQAAAVGLGWIADTALGGLANHFNLSELMTLAGLGAGSSSPESLGKAALGAALGPLGDILGNTWGGVNDALAGGGAEDDGSGGDSSSGSSSDSGHFDNDTGRSRPRDKKPNKKSDKSSNNSSNGHDT